MQKYKIGQILTANTDIEIERAISGEKVTVPKGSKVIVGADRMAHHFSNGMIQTFAKDAVIKGYDAEGIALYLYTMLNSRYDLDQHIEDQDCTKWEFMDSIAEYLREVGFDD